MLLPSKTLKNRAIVEPYIGATGKNGQKYGGEVIGVKCALSRRRAVIRAQHNTTVVARASADFRPEDRMPTLSRITIDGEVYEALEIAPIMGPNRIIGYRVMLG